MCGIVGAWSPEKLNPTFQDERTLRRMTGSLKSRGPCDQNILLANNFFLGHTRLSILDLENGNQPMGFNRKDYLIYNGEIYNYLELRNEYLGDIQFHTKSDTEVLYHLCNKFGQDAVPMLNGDFAFAYINKEENSLTLARDRFGIKPLFYSKVDDTIIFASSAKALLEHPSLKNELDTTALTQTSLLWTPAPQRSFFKNIHSLLPGEVITFKKDRISHWKYWELSFENRFAGTYEEGCKEVNQLMSNAVNIRLRSDVEVGAYVSGGLDSTINVALMKSSQEKIRSFSVGFADQDYDESNYQRMVISKLGIDSTILEIKDEEIGAAFEKVVSEIESPVFRTAPVPMYLLSKEVNRQGIRVVLTGEGADEAFWGYDSFKEARLRDEIARGESVDVSAALSSMYPYLKHFSPNQARFMAAFFKETSTNPADPFFTHSMRIQNGFRTILPIFREELRDQLLKEEWQQDFLGQLPKTFNNWNVLQKNQYWELKTLLNGYLLSSQGDRMLMANSVEGRFPFLDHRVVELAASLPDSFKLNQTNEKRILKDTFQNYLPEEIKNRPKNPYRAPEGKSFLNSGLIEKYLSSEEIAKAGILSKDKIDGLISKITKGTSSFNDNFSFVFALSLQIHLNQIRTPQTLQAYDEIPIIRI